MNIASLNSYSSYSTSAAALGASVVTSGMDGSYIETVSRLKVSELDGKNVTSMYQSGPGEGDVINRIALNAAKTPVQPAASVDMNLPSADFPAAQQPAPAPQPAPTGGPAAAASAYQAVSGFGGGTAAGGSTFSFSS